eukprot:scaffold271879_cov30-Tisochrysis_lutea.AAC.7
MAWAPWEHQHEWEVRSPCEILAAESLLLRTREGPRRNVFDPKRQVCAEALVADGGSCMAWTRWYFERKACSTQVRGSLCRGKRISRL